MSNGDSPYLLGALLMRMVSPVDHQAQDVLMSVLRVLALNPDLASDPTIPKVQPKSGGSLINIPYKNYFLFI